MAAKKPFRFTSRSYVIDKTGNGSTRCLTETVFEQVPSPNGTYEFKVVSRKKVEDADECFDRMADNASKIMSEYVSNHPESAFWKKDEE